MPSVVLHSDPHLWGEAVDKFDHRRFLRTSSSVNDFAREQTTAAAQTSPFGFPRFWGWHNAMPRTTLRDQSDNGGSDNVRNKVWHAIDDEWREMIILTAHKIIAVAAVKQPMRRLRSKWERERDIWMTTESLASKHRSLCLRLRLRICHSYFFYFFDLLFPACMRGAALNLQYLSIINIVKWNQSKQRREN
jgi:hypothetical protein